MKNEVSHFLIFTPFFICIVSYLSLYCLSLPLYCLISLIILSLASIFLSYFSHYIVSQYLYRKDELHRQSSVAGRDGHLCRDSRLDDQRELQWLARQQGWLFPLTFSSWFLFLETVTLQSWVQSRQLDTVAVLLGVVTLMTWRCLYNSDICEEFSQ